MTMPSDSAGGSATKPPVGCYFARCECGCGAVVVVMTDYPQGHPETPRYAAELRKSNAKECAKLMRSGLTVEHADDMETVRPLFGRCKKLRAARQPEEKA